MKQSLCARVASYQFIPLAGILQAVVFQQSKDQPNRFSGSESECALILALVGLIELEVMAAPELVVASTHRSGSFKQVAAEITVAGFSHPGISSLEFTGLVLRPGDPGKPSGRDLGTKSADITGLSDNIGGIGPANAGDGNQGIWRDPKLLFNGLVQHLDLLFQSRMEAIETVIARFTVSFIVLGSLQGPLDVVCTTFAVAAESANLLRPARGTKAVDSAKLAFAKPSTVSKHPIRAMVAALVFWISLS